jgi:hypothetical protein
MHHLYKLYTETPKISLGSREQKYKMMVEELLEKQQNQNPQTPQHDYPIQFTPEEIRILEQDLALFLDKKSI